jgi:hypothetical protein
LCCKRVLLCERALVDWLLLGQLLNVVWGYLPVQYAVRVFLQLLLRCL